MRVLDHYLNVACAHIAKPESGQLTSRDVAIPEQLVRVAHARLESSLHVGHVIAIEKLSQAHGPRGAFAPRDDGSPRRRRRDSAAEFWSRLRIAAILIARCTVRGSPFSSTITRGRTTENGPTRVIGTAFLFFKSTLLAGQLPCGPEL